MHPAMVAADAPPRRVLILGGGDGLALREVLAHPSVEQVTLVDLDPAMTRLAQAVPAARRAQSRTRSPTGASHVVNDDAMVWLDEHTATCGTSIIVDFPDPNTFALGKLYTKLFYRGCSRGSRRAARSACRRRRRCSRGASYWCVDRDDARRRASSCGRTRSRCRRSACGASRSRSRRRSSRRRTCRTSRCGSSTTPRCASMFEMPADMTPVPVEINQLDNQVLVRYYEREWKRWQQ